MNKKILSIFALIMALSFAVSCSNEDKSGAGGNNGGGSGTGGGKEITLEKIQEAVQALGTVTAADNKGSIDFSKATVTKDAKVSVIAKKGTASLSAGALKTALDEVVATQKLKDKITAIDSKATVVFDTANVTTGNKTASFTVKITASTDYSITGFNTDVVKEKTVTITVTLNGKDSAGTNDENFAA